MYQQIHLPTKQKKGKSGQGGNKQITDRAKKYIMFPSVEAGMSYIAEFILRYIWKCRKMVFLQKCKDPLLL